MAIEVFKRFEHKYILDKETYNKVVAVLEVHMELDAYNAGHRPYTITNIYYDTEASDLIRKSIEKPKYKEKLRLRSYGVPDADSQVFLEIKKKYDGLVGKRRTLLQLQEAYAFPETGKSYTVQIGEQTHTLTVESQTTTIGTQSGGNIGGFGGMGNMGGMNGGRTPRTMQ